MLPSLWESELLFSRLPLFGNMTVIFLGPRVPNTFVWYLTIATSSHCSDSPRTTLKNQIEYIASSDSTIGVLEVVKKTLTFFQIRPILRSVMERPVMRMPFARGCDDSAHQFLMLRITKAAIASVERAKNAVWNWWIREKAVSRNDISKPKQCTCLDLIESVHMRYCAVPSFYVFFKIYFYDCMQAWLKVSGWKDISCKEPWNKTCMQSESLGKTTSCDEFFLLTESTDWFILVISLHTIHI